MTQGKNTIVEIKKSEAPDGSLQALGGTKLITITNISLPLACQVKELLHSPPDVAAKAVMEETRLRAALVLVLDRDVLTTAQYDLIGDELLRMTETEREKVQTVLRNDIGSTIRNRASRTRHKLNLLVRRKEDTRPGLHLDVDA